MEKLSVSIVIPVYNSEKYLKQCLDSIVGQSYKNFQIVLVDDGSTDRSGDICNEYARKDDRFKVIHQKNAGTVKARKVGAIEADGDYVYYVDSDDWLEKNTMEVFANIVQQYGVDMIWISNKKEYENGKCFTSYIPFENGLYSKLWIRNRMIYQLMNTNRFYENSQRLTLWNYLINRKLLLKNQKVIDDRIRLLDDATMVYFCLLDADNIYVYKDIYYHYMQRSNTLKKRRDPKDLERLQLAYKALVNKFVREEESEILLKQAKYLVLYSMLLSVDGQLKITHGLFPYRDFQKGSRVVVYGAGVFGRKVVDVLIQTRYAEIVAWVDENFLAYQKEGFQVESPDMLLDLEYDYIILGVLLSNIREDIIHALVKYHVEKERIIDIDLNKIDNTSLPVEFEKTLQKVYSIC